MLDKFQKCPYCEKKTCFLVCGYIGEPGGDYVRCYRCKRAWRTNWAHLTKRAPDALRAYDMGEVAGVKLTYVKGNVFATPAKRR